MLVYPELIPLNNSMAQRLPDVSHSAGKLFLTHIKIAPRRLRRLHALLRVGEIVKRRLICAWTPEVERRRCSKTLSIRTKRAGAG